LVRLSNGYAGKLQNKMIIILQKDKITHKVREKLLKKGLSLIGISDKEIIFVKLKREFV
jgi:hypothetical protein